MFERFNAEARDTMRKAYEQAREVRSPLVGTEHLLLVLAGAPTATGQELRTRDITPEAVQAALTRRQARDSLASRAADLFTAEDAAALRTVGVDLDEVLDRLQDLYGDAEPPADPGRTRHPGWRFSPHARKALQVALREALRLRTKQITPEHLLLGMLRAGDGLAVRILDDLDIDRTELTDGLERSARSAA